jgi:uncharacterized membrane protein
MRWPQLKQLYKISAVSAVALAFLVASALSSSAVGASPEDVKLTTPFPKIQISTGQGVTLEVKVVNLTAHYQNVGLAISAPENWQASLQSSGYVINMITLEPSESRTISLIATPPAGVSAGTYSLLVRATDQSGNELSSLNVTVDIAKSTALGILLSTSSPSIEGPAGQNFSFTVSVTNQTGLERDIAFSAMAPTDWTVTFKEQYYTTLIRTLHLNSGEKKSLEVTVSPPSNATAGKYDVTIQASSGAYSQSLTLTPVITGTYKLDLSTPDGLLNFNAPQGAVTSVTLVVKNSGSAPLQNLSFTSSNPSGWDITFDPNQVSSIPPGSTVQVSARVKPPADAIPGDYSVYIYANAEPRATSARIDFRVTVIGSVAWGLVGLGIIVVVIAGLIVIFWRLGRR